MSDHLQNEWDDAIAGTMARARAEMLKSAPVEFPGLGVIPAWPSLSAAPVQRQAEPPAGDPPAPAGEPDGLQAALAPSAPPPVLAVDEDIQEAAYDAADVLSDIYGCDDKIRARLTGAFEQAIQSERERCAKIADKYAMAHHIVAAIRKGSRP